MKDLTKSVLIAAPASVVGGALAFAAALFAEHTGLERVVNLVLMFPFHVYGVLFGFGLMDRLDANQRIAMVVVVQFVGYFLVARLLIAIGRWRAARRVRAGEGT